VFVENGGLPAAVLIFLPLAMAYLAAQGRLNSLVGWSLTLFGALLAYRILLAFLVSFFGQAKTRPYQRRLLAPVFWILLVVWVSAAFIDLSRIAEVELFRWSDENSFIIGRLFWTLLVLYFLFTFAWIVQEIILHIIEPRTTIESGTINAALTIGRYVVLAVAALIVSYEIGFDPTSLTVIAGGLSVGIGFGMQSIFSNFISGILLLFEQSLRPGDVVEVDGVLGTVENLGIRATTVRTYDNIEMIIPNETFFTSTVTTYTHGSRITRIMLTVGVSYESDPQQVIDILKDTAQRHGLVLNKPAPEVYFENYGDSSIDFHLAIWVAEPNQRIFVPSDLRLMIWKEFQKHNIEIPFPQRDLHLRSGVPWEIVKGDTELPE
jgi:small-conductance mechanosensitive channel